MATKDWEKIRGKDIWRNNKVDTVSIYYGKINLKYNPLYIVNVESKSGKYLAGFSFTSKSKALASAKSYMRTH